MPAIRDFPPLALCVACQLLFSPHSDSSDKHGTTSGKKKAFRHDIFTGDDFYFRKVRKDVETEAKRGCALCHYVVLVDKRCTEEEWKRCPSREPQGDDELELYLKYNQELGRLRIGSARRKHSTRESCDWYIRTTDGKSAIKTQTLEVAVSFTQQRFIPGDPAAALPIPRISLEELPSQEGLASARQWLSQCLEKEWHACPKNERVKLPTRLVEVSPQGVNAARLRLTDGQEGRYAALSYCWGGPQPFRTVADSLTAYTEEIPFSKLPKTILDAFEVTRRLGLQYIWIDSLCIVQDDEDDKDRELPRMRRIYENAFVTISAASASSCTQGFLDPRANPRSPRYLAVRVDNETIGSVLVATRPETLEFTDRKTQPINDRAWTLQEAWVSPRLLVFAGMAVFWKCGRFSWQSWRPRRRPFHEWGSDWDSDSDCTDCYGDLESNLEYVWGKSSGYVERLGTRTAGSQSWHPAAARQIWESIVHNYTQRGLSLDKDKLPAISAIAETLSPLLGGGYLAGLWRQHLERDLLWCAEGGDGRFTGHGPTWSWASNAGTIRFENARNLVWNPSPLIQVVDCSVVLASEGVTYGAVESGELVIEGHIVELAALPDVDVDWDDTRSCQGRFPQGVSDGSRRELIESLGRDAPSSVSYWALTIATSNLDARDDPDDPFPGATARGAMGLVLTLKSGVGAGLFRRVGLFKCKFPRDLEPGKESSYRQGRGRKVVKIL
jgi:hypothetical protein